MTEASRSTLVSLLMAAALPLSTAAQPPPGAARNSEQAPPEGARIESVELVDRIEADGTALRRQRTRVRVIDAAGVAALSQVGVPYFESNQKIELTRLTLLKPDGREIDLLPTAPRDVAPVYPPNLPIYSDLRVLRAAVPSIEIGDRLDWETTVTVSPLVPGEVWSEATFAPADQVDLQTYELDSPEALALRVHVRSGFGGVSTEERAAGRVVRRWRLEGRPAADSDEESPAASEPGWEPDVAVSTFASWDEFAHWWGALAPPVVDDAVRAKARELAGDAAEPRAKLERLHRYVAQEIRYLALPLGLGRYRARAPEEVMRTGLGDCKDKIRLLASLARAMGLEVDPVLVGVERRRRVDAAPSPASFDHVIARLRLAGEELWLDPTSEMTALGALPAAARDLPGLALVGTEGSLRTEPVTTPDAPPYETWREVATTATIDPAGRIHGTVRWTFRGDDEPWRLAFRYGSKEDQRRLAESMSRAWGKNREVTDVRSAEAGDLASPFWFEYDVERPLKPTLWAGTWDLWLPLPDVELPSPPEATTRAGAAPSPLELEPPVRRTMTLRLELPVGVRVTPPVPVSAVRDFAAFRSDYRLEGRTLVVERELVLTAPEVAPERFAELEAMAALIEEDRDQELDFAAAPELVPTEAGTADAAAALCDAALDGERWQEAEKHCRRAVELDPAHPEAWDDLGRALAGLERVDEAEAAHRRQLEIAPGHDSAWANLSILARGRGDFEEAERLARRQVEATPFVDYGHQHLALALLARGRTEEAEAALVRAARLEPDDAWTRRELLRVQARLGRCAELLAEARSPEPAPELEVRTAVVEALLRWDCRPLAPAVDWIEDLGRDLEAELAGLELRGIDAGDYRSAGGLVAVWLARGVIALERGDVAAANRLFEVVLAVSPSPAAALRRAEALEALGRAEEAERHFALAVALGGDERAASEERFVAAVPSPLDRGRLLAFAGEESWKLRSLSFEAPGAAGVEARLQLLFSPEGRLVEFSATGEETKPEVYEALGGALPTLRVPDANRARIPRRADVSCNAEGRCTLVYDWPYQAARELERPD